MTRRDFLLSLGILPATASLMSLHELERLTDPLPETPLMPVLFLGHGSPMNAIEENTFVQGFRRAAAKLPRPRAILCVSAHWLTRGTQVTAMEHPKTIHDFGGFPQALFDVQYPAPGSPELARETRDLLAPVSVAEDQNWGLDHGAWSVIKHLYPKADIPVVQLSLDYTLSGEGHAALARQLQALRKKGVLIVGSGNIVHNLGMVDFARINDIGYGFDWAIESRALINRLMLSGDLNTLAHPEKLGKAVNLAVPTPDHYWPLLYVLALRGKNEPISLFNDELLAGSLSMTSVWIGEEG